VKEMKPEAKKSEETEEAKVLVLSHCILNRATRWWQNGRPIERNQGPIGQVLEFLSSRNIGAVQLPCPEFVFLGNPRSPATKDEYENLPGFRAHCESLAKDLAQHLRTLVTMARRPRIKLIALSGVERSPTCGVKCTPRTVNGKTEYVEEKGLFIEFLEREIRNHGLEIPIIGLDMNNPRDFCRRLSDLLDKTSGG
jgi:predicted secreted protein